MEQFGKTCLPDETKYKFKAQYDKVTGAPYVDCCKFFLFQNRSYVNKSFIHIF